MQWRETTLGEVCDKVGGIIQTGPFGSQLHASDYSPDGIPVVMPKDIIGGRVATDGIARVSEEHVQRLLRHKLCKGDIVYGRRGDIGRQALVGEREEGWLCGTGCLRVSLGDTAIDPMFLHFYLDQPSVIDWITNQAIGATLPNLNTSILRSVPIRFPPLPTQRKIAAILSAYDDLIEVNQRRIRILEEMAQSLYREWFVRFRFPGHESARWVESEMGRVPEGWEVMRIGEAFTTVLGGTPSRAREEYWNNGTVPWINSGKVNELRIVEPSEFITDLGYARSSAKLMPAGTTVLAITGATLGQVSILGAEMSANQSVVGIYEQEGIYREYVYRTIQHRIGSIIKHASGGAQQHINKDVVNAVALYLPPHQILTSFNSLAFPIGDLILNLLYRNAKLRATRDLLLPRLISGEVEV